MKMREIREQRILAKKMVENAKRQRALALEMRATAEKMLKHAHASLLPVDRRGLK